MKVRSAKIIVLLLTAAGLAFVAGVTVMLVVPSLRELHSISDDIIAAQTELEAQYANRRHLLDSIDEIRKVQDTVEKLSSQFVPEKQELSFITAVEEIAARREVEERIRLSAGTTPPLEELHRAFELVLTGEFRRVALAMLDLERLPNLLVIDAVVVNASQAAPDQPAPISVVLRGTIASPPKGL